MVTWRLLVPALVAGVLLLPAAAAATTEAAPELSVRLLGVDAEPDGTTSAAVSVQGLPPGEQIDLTALRIVENGQPVEGLRVVEATSVETSVTRPGVVVAIDVSGSTQGAPIDAALSAATDLLRSVASSGALVGAVSFSQDVATVAPLSDSGETVAAAVQGLEAAGETALFDGVSRAARLLASHDGPRDVVLFSDGDDTVSSAGLDDVRALLSETEVRVTSVALDSGDLDVNGLRAIADVSGGSLVEVADTAQLVEAFATVAADLSNRIEVRWEVDPVSSPPRELNVVATYESEAGVASDGAQVVNPRSPAIAPPREVPGTLVPVPALASATGLAVGIATLAVAVAVFAFLILAAAGDRRRQGRIDERLAAYADTTVTGTATDPADRSLADRAAGALEIISGPTTLDEEVAARIEYADWPLRTGEFFLLSFGGATTAALAGSVLGSWPLGIALGMLGLAGPLVILNVAVGRRRRAFDEQLPVLLQVLSGALRAGHSFTSALDGAVSEVDEPAKTELRRASVEARLGRPVEEALFGVARRMDSMDLRWVIGALDVQREVGGNLAEVLNNVAGTLRARSSVKRQVRALSAEGRLSATVISLMPFALVVILTIINPGYLDVLVVEPLGRVLLVVGGSLLLVGVLWLRRLVQPRY